MAENNDGQEKSEDPTQHRIDEFRKKGEVAASKEINSLFILTGVFCALSLSSFFIFEQFYQFFDWILVQDHRQIFKPENFGYFVREMASTFAMCLLPVLSVSFCLSFLSQVMQVGLIYAPEVLQIKWERLDPIKGAQKLFSLKAIFEIAKGLVKFSIILGMTYFILSQDLLNFRGFLHSDISSGMSFAGEVLVKLFISIFPALAIMALLDFAWEKFRHLQKLKMSKQEVKEEQKQKEGNPEIRQRIRQIQREMGRKRMMQEVPNADAIITNPTHISVAIRYDLKTMSAPVVIAKGADNLAFQIRRIAEKNGIPLVENKPLARGLYKSVSVGSIVPRDYYQAVAEILAFVYKLKKKIKKSNFRSAEL